MAIIGWFSNAPREALIARRQWILHGGCRAGTVLRASPSADALTSAGSPFGNRDVTIPTGFPLVQLSRIGALLVSPGFCLSPFFLVQDQVNFRLSFTTDSLLGDPPEGQTRDNHMA